MAPRQRSPPQRQQSSDIVDITKIAASSSNNTNKNNLKENEKEPLVEKATTVIKKSESQQDEDDLEADRARDHHDMFNLVALLPPVVIMMFNWDYNKLINGYGAEASWNPVYFMEMWVATLLYFFLDLIWVAFTPKCVKSPGIIIKHHLAALIYLWGPILWPQFNWFMGVILTIEINTWFLIARRYLYKRVKNARKSNNNDNNKKSFSYYLTKFLLDFVSYMFYTTWIVIRMVIFPQILIIMLTKAYVHIRATGTCMHAPILFIPLHAFFCLLNLKWSYDLFTPIIKKWIRSFNGNNNTEETKIATGL